MPRLWCAGIGVASGPGRPRRVSEGQLLWKVSRVKEVPSGCRTRFWARSKSKIDRNRARETERRAQKRYFSPCRTAIRRPICHMSVHDITPTASPGTAPPASHPDLGPPAPSTPATAPPAPSTPAPSTPAPSTPAPSTPATPRPVRLLGRLGKLVEAGVDPPAPSPCKHVNRPGCGPTPIWARSSTRCVKRSAGWAW